MDAAREHAAKVGVVFENGGKQRERRVRIGDRRRHVRNNGLDQGGQGGSLLARLARSPTVARGGEQRREVELLVGRLERGEKVEHRLLRFFRLGIGAVDLVDHHNRLQAQRQRLGGDELGLRHRAFGGVDQQ